MKSSFDLFTCFYYFGNPVHLILFFNLFTILVTFVTGFCLFLIEFEISLQIALPTTNPSAFLRDFIVFSVIPNPMTTFLDLL
jgi:hypothetical protein